MTNAHNIPVHNFRQVAFLTSAATLKDCPPDTGAEVAFAGRSNAGKSSAINALTGNRKMAKTSKTPGRTQLINFFTLTEELRLVDLPGYGFAKVPLAVKEKWQRHLEDYLRNRQTLKGLVLLMDCRHPLQDFDRMMLDWAQNSNMPVHVLLTKSDKLKNGPAQSTLLSVRKELTATYNVATVQLFSSTKRSGLDQLMLKISEWLQTGAEDVLNPEQ